MLLGAAGAMLPAASGVRWLGWIALVLGVLMFTPVGFFAFLGSGLWIALASVAMTMHVSARSPRVCARAPLAARRSPRGGTPRP